MEKKELSKLRFSWSAVVRLRNGIRMRLWWSSWAMREGSVEEVESVASDWPKKEIVNH